MSALLSLLSLTQTWATAGRLALSCGAGLGSVTRDLLDAGPRVVAPAWIAGAVLGVLARARGGCSRPQG